MSEILRAKKRTETGTLRMRRLRQAGQIPAVLYGHGEKTMHLAVDSRDVQSAMRHGNQLIELQGDVKTSALIKQVQWDAFGIDVLHLDFTRVKATEQIEVEVAIELRGDAPGTHQGGILDQNIHEVTVSCPANRLPEKLELNINELELNQSLALRDLELPPGVKLVGDLDATVVQCVEPIEEPAEEELEEADAAAAGTEPELIGRHREEEESEENSG